MKKIEVVAAAIIEKCKVLITKRKGGTFHDMGEFLGSKIKRDETHHKALIREIKEELLCLIEPKDHLITIHYQYPAYKSY